MKDGIVLLNKTVITKQSGKKTTYSLEKIHFKYEVWEVENKRM